MGLYRWLKFQTAKYFGLIPSDVQIVPYDTQELFNLLEVLKVPPKSINIAPLVKADGFQGVFYGWDETKAADTLEKMGYDRKLARFAVSEPKKLYDDSFTALMLHPFKLRELPTPFYDQHRQELAEKIKNMPFQEFKESGKGEENAVKRTAGEIFSDVHGFDNLPERSGPTEHDLKCKYHPRSREDLMTLARDPQVFLGDIDTSAITDMSGVFENCSRRSYEGLESWNVRNVRNFDRMFKGARHFTGLVQVSQRKAVKNENGEFEHVWDPDAPVVTFDPQNPGTRVDVDVFDYWNTASAVSCDEMCARCPVFRGSLFHLNVDHVKNFDLSYAENMVAASPLYKRRLNVVLDSHTDRLNILKSSINHSDLDSSEKYQKELENVLSWSSSCRRDDLDDISTDIGGGTPVWPLKKDGRIKGVPFHDEILESYLQHAPRNGAINPLGEIWAVSYDEFGKSHAFSSVTDPADISSYDLSAQKNLRKCCQHGFDLSRGDQVSLKSLEYAYGFLKGANAGVIDISEAVNLRRADHFCENSGVLVKGTDRLKASKLQSAEGFLKDNHPARMENGAVIPLENTVYSLKVFANSKHLENIKDAFVQTSAKYNGVSAPSLDASACDEIRLHGEGACQGFGLGMMNKEVRKDFVLSRTDQINNYSASDVAFTIMPDEWKVKSDDDYLRFKQNLARSNYDTDRDMKTLADSFAKLPDSDHAHKVALAFGFEFGRSGDTDKEIAAILPERLTKDEIKDVVDFTHVSQGEKVYRPTGDKELDPKKVSNVGGYPVMLVDASELRNINQKFWEKCAENDGQPGKQMPEDFNFLSDESRKKYNVDLDGIRPKLYNNICKFGNTMSDGKGPDGPDPNSHKHKLHR